MAKYLDSTGLGHYDTRIKGYVDDKVDTEVTIKTIKLNGTEVAPASKVVNIVVDAAKVGADPAGTASGLMSDHVADANAHSAIFANYVPKSQLGTEAGDVPVLDSNGKLDTSVIPSLAIMDVYTVASQTAMLALECQKGDIAVRTDVNKTFILTQTPASTLANWTELRSPDCKVTSVAGKTGAVTLVKGDVGLGNVDNTSDTDKPISTATQTALNGKVPATRKVNGHALSADVTVTKSDVGLGNVDNTSDKNKPISTATQTALDNKQDKVDSRINVGDSTLNGDVAMSINHVYGIASTAEVVAEGAGINVTKLIDGTTPAGKATADGKGNNIAETYATITALAGKQDAMTAITNTEIDALFA